MLTRRNIDIKRNRIVRVVVTLNDNEISYGTGFFVLPNGLFLTCGHVILGRDFTTVQRDQEFINTQGDNNIEKAKNYHTAITNNIKIELENGTLKDAVLEKIDPDYDAALLRVNEDGFSHRYFRTERNSEPHVGEEISFYGFPEVLGYTYQNSPFVVNRSIISTFPVTAIGGSNYRHMQINATTIGGGKWSPGL